MRLLRCGVLDQCVDKPKGVNIRVQVGKRVVAVGLLHVDEVENRHLVAHLLKQTAHSAVGFALWVTYDVGTFRLHEIRLDEKACLACAGAANHQNVCVHLMLRRQCPDIHADTDMPGNEQIAVVLLGSEVGAYLFRTPPVGRAVFLTWSAVALFGVVPRHGKAIERQRNQHKFLCVWRNVDGKRGFQCSGKGVQPFKQPKTFTTAPTAQQCQPDHENGKRRPKQDGASVGIALHGLVAGLRQSGDTRLVDRRYPAVSRHDPLSAVQAAYIGAVCKLIAVV